MPIRSLPHVLSIAVVLALAGPAAAAAGDPQFAIVNWTSPPPGSASFDEVPCPVGKHPPGLPVMLFGATGGPACSGVTREVTQGVIAGTCTRVEVAPGCDGSGASVAVIGASSLDRLRLFPKAPIQDPARLAEWSRQVSASGLLPAVAARGKRWECREPIVIASTPAEAFTFDGLPQSPVFLRLPVTEEGGKASYPLRSATLLVVEGSKVTAPFDVHGLEPFAFGIGDAQFLVGGSGCGDCGMRVDQIYAVEKGKLRLLVQTSDLST